MSLFLRILIGQLTLFVIPINAINLLRFRTFPANRPLDLPALGDIPFKQPPAFTRRILYNLYPGFTNVSPWEEFLQRNRTPPYIDARPEITHVSLDKQTDNLKIDGHTGTKRIYREQEGPAPGPRFLVLSSDGFADLCSGEGQQRILKNWAESVADSPAATSPGPVLPSENLAVRLLRRALGEDCYSVSRVLTLDMDLAWIDDTSIVVQTL